MLRRGGRRPAAHQGPVRATHRRGRGRGARGVDRARRRHGRRREGGPGAVPPGRAGRRRDGAGKDPAKEPRNGG